MSNPITNELRARVIEKFKVLGRQLQINSTAEDIENSCFEKSENNAESYVKVCQNFITNRKKQLETQMAQGQLNTMQNYRPNMAGTSNNGTPSDPINALQNLTVTAGQPNRINMQPTTVPQLMTALGVNNNMFTSPICQRQMIPVTLQSGNNNMQRHMEQMPMSQSPTTQIIQSPIQQGHPINSLNMVNANVRVITKNVNVQNSPMPVTYQMDNTNGAQVPGQQMLGINQRPQMARMVTNSPLMPNNISQQVQVQPQLYQDQYAIMKPSPVATPLQSEELNNQNTIISNSQSNVTINNVSAPITVSNNQAPQPPPPPPPSSVPPKVMVSDEEFVKVRESLSILSQRYLKSIELLMENPEHMTPEGNIKVWTTIKSVLIDPNYKNVSLKHVARIQDLCERAEKTVQENNLDKTKSLVVPKSDELFGKRVIPDRNRINVVAGDVASVNLDISGATTNNAANSLDAAFDDVIHQLMNKDAAKLRQMQKHLVTFVRNCAQYIHYLPRNLQKEDQLSDSESNKMDLGYDEHEFDYIDDMMVIDGVDKCVSVRRHRALDQQGLLRTDLDTSLLSSSDLDGIEGEMALIRGEFSVTPVADQMRSSAWFTKDYTWDKSTFYAVTCHLCDDKLSVSVPVPPLLIRVPLDYDQSGSIDWCLNLPLYSAMTTTGATDHKITFLDEVRHALQTEFADFAAQHHWSGVNLLQVLTVYKRSIEIGQSNFECRKTMS